MWKKIDIENSSPRQGESVLVRYKDNLQVVVGRLTRNGYGSDCFSCFGWDISVEAFDYYTEIPKFDGDKGE
jgi:hypothetical protein